MARSVANLAKLLVRQERQGIVRLMQLSLRIPFQLPGHEATSITESQETNTSINVFNGDESYRALTGRQLRLADFRKQKGNVSILTMPHARADSRTIVSSMRIWGD
jgi:hypothetical protein